MNKKECKIIGYGSYADKETGELKFRICMCVDGNNPEKYTGKVAVFAFLSQTDELENKLKRAVINENVKCYYTTEENIVTGKTRVSDIYVD